MKSGRSGRLMAVCLAVCGAAVMAPGNLRAWEPNKADLVAAANSGSFGGYVENLSKWLSQRTPTAAGDVTEATFKTICKDPIALSALCQRTFLVKYGVGNVENFVKADAGNKAFVLWIMQDTRSLDQFLIGAVPIGLRQREDNSFGIPGNALNIWKTIYDADPESRQGLYLRLAMATALNPPGTGCRGSGQPAKQEEPLARYLHFKAAHKNGELFPSFEKLTVWELRHVTCSMASNADLTWGRQMVNTWNPDFRKGELVVDTTSQMWRRNSPISHGESYKNVLAGGGKCGPRSSWSVFICQAFGIPATGVGQPAHACVAYRKTDGNWTTAYGRSWAASKLLGISGGEFVEGVAARLQTRRFALVEHMRWLALALPAANQPAMLELAKNLTKAQPTAEDLADMKAAEAPPAPAAPNPPAAPATPPVFTAKGGAFHIDAASFCENGGIPVFGGYPGVGVMDSYPAGTGKQIHFAANMGTVWAGYKIEVPETGYYELTVKGATINFDQYMLARSYGAMYPVKNATASQVYKNWVKDLGPQMAVDSNPGTRWAVIEGVEDAWLEVDLGEPKPITTVMIDERFFNRISRFAVEYKLGTEWKPIFEDKSIGIAYEKTFPSVTAQHVRLHTFDSFERGGPTIWEFSLGTVKNGAAWVHFPCTYGLWGDSKAAEIRLVKGAQTIWLLAPFQRGVTVKSLDLKWKGAKPTASAATPAAGVPSASTAEDKE